MRICTYNIHAGRDAGGRASLPAIGATLREREPDVCLLQEVDRFLPRSGFQDQAALLAGVMDAEPCFHARLRWGKAGFGNAILSRPPIRDVTRVALPGGGEPRGAVGVTLDSGLRVWNTHLGLRSDWRLSQLGALAQALSGDEPLVLGGDFNTTLADDGLQAFLITAGLEPLSPDAPTFPVPGPQKRIDFLFGRGVTVQRAGTTADPGSDHCLVWAEVEPEERPSAPPPVPAS